MGGTTTSQTYIISTRGRPRSADPGQGVDEGGKATSTAWARPLPGQDSARSWPMARPPGSTASTPATTGDAARLGIAARRGRGSARFDTITQDWLRDAVKRWSRFRLATGCAFTTINAGALAMSRFSAFLAERHPGIAGEAGITRPVLEDYLSWLLEPGLPAPPGRSR